MYSNMRVLSSSVDGALSFPRSSLCFEMRATGQPYDLIARTLSKEGFTSGVRKRRPIGTSYTEKIINNPFYYGVMIHDGRQYPHKYGPLISRKLFNQCLDVKQQRGHTPTKSKAEPYTLKSITKCGRCGRAISSYVGRKQVYLRCAASGSKSCGNPNVAERHLIPGIEFDLGMMQIPVKHIGKVIDKLKLLHENQQLFFTNSIEGNRLEYDTLKQRLNTLYEDRLDGRISAERYDNLAGGIERKQQDLNDNLKDLTSDNKSFLVTSSYLIDLCQRGNELFKRSNPALRQQLLQFVLSNVELNDKVLSYELRNPFKTIAEGNKKDPEGSKSAIWQGYVESNHDLRFWRPIY